MRHRPQVVVLVCSLAALISWGVERSEALVTETYLFRDSFAPREGAGNVLVPVSNATGTIVTSGPDFVNGAFVDEAISASACASTPTVRAWSFPNNGGLRYDNATPTVVTGSYSISMLMRYNPMDTGYARLIDFSNSTQDIGIYKLNGGVSFYPVGFFAMGSFVQDQDVFVTITRDGTSKLVSLYINGVPSGTYSDTTDLYAPLATVVYLLMDNTTGPAAISETDPGVIAYLQVSDTPLTAAEVAASLADICGAVSCGDGIVSGGEACDDHNTLPGDGCSPTCTVEECWQCTGSPSTCTPLPQNTACTPGADPCVEYVCDGAGTCGEYVCGATTTAPASTTTTSSTTATSTTTTSSTTSSTTTTAATTTTTAPAGGCSGTPDGPTFDSILCRLDALGGRVGAEVGLANFQSKLAKSLQSAASDTDDARTLCAASNAKKAKKRLQEAAKALSQYAHRLASLSARHKLDPTVRTTYLQAGAPIGADLRTLRAGLHCPPA
jgi:cysteine-rich repeat protein